MKVLILAHEKKSLTRSVLFVHDYLDHSGLTSGPSPFIPSVFTMIKQWWRNCQTKRKCDRTWYHLFL